VAGTYCPLSLLFAIDKHHVADIVVITNRLDLRRACELSRGTPVLPSSPCSVS